MEYSYSESLLPGFSSKNPDNTTSFVKKKSQKLHVNFVEILNIKRISIKEIPVLNKSFLIFQEDERQTAMLSLDIFKQVESSQQFINYIELYDVSRKCLFSLLDWTLDEFLNELKNSHL